MDRLFQPDEPASKPLGDTQDDIAGDICWSELEQSGKVPSPRSGHTACVIERLCYVFGGCGCEPDGDVAHVYNDLHVLDMATRTWDRLDCPTETGMYSEASSCCESVRSLDMRGLIVAAPPPRWGHTCTAVSQDGMNVLISTPTDLEPHGMSLR
jgi:hypothetical protein